jgi:hypothetical protein
MRVGGVWRAEELTYFEVLVKHIPEEFEKAMSIK